MLKTYHHGDLRDELLNAGEQALSEMAADKVTLREIARRAGVSHAAPRHHFPSLSHLLAEIAVRGFSRFIDALDEAARSTGDQSPQGRLLAMGRAYLRFAEQNPQAYQLMFGMQKPGIMSPNLAAAYTSAWEQLNHAVVAVVGPALAEAAILHVWSTVHGLAALKLARCIPPHMPIHRLEEQQLALMMTGLKAE